MSGELRAIGWAQGLLLGLVLGAPLIGTAWLPAGVDALFIIGAFQLRLADRRWQTRPGLRGWISHIRMAPARILPWAAMALVTAMAGDAALGGAIAMAALLCELLIYPIGAPLLGKASRAGSLGVLSLALAGSAAPIGPTAHLVLGFMTGMAACMIWLRGPDGDGRALMLASVGALAAAALTFIAPAAAALLWPTATICATWALAHLSVLRRRPLPWGRGSIGRFRPSRARHSSQPS